MSEAIKLRHADFYFDKVLVKTLSLFVEQYLCYDKNIGNKSAIFQEVDESDFIRRTISFPCAYVPMRTCRDDIRRRIY